MIDCSTKEPPKASSIKSAESCTTIPFDLCKPRNSETGFTVFTVTVSDGTSMSVPSKQNKKHKEIYKK